MSTPLTVGTLRTALRGLPASTPINVVVTDDNDTPVQNFAESVTVYDLDSVPFVVIRDSE